MPAVKSVFFAIIIAGEFSVETQQHTLKHDAVHSMAVITQLAHFSVTALRKVLQARQLQSGKEQVIASNSINLHNRKLTERRWYPTKACVFLLQQSHKRLHLHLDEPWICLQIPNSTPNKQFISEVGAVGEIALQQHPALQTVCQHQSQMS